MMQQQFKNILPMKNNELDCKTESAINILIQKSKELNRLPKRSDFEPKTVCFIKQKLGPWPRALERAGLKAEKGENTN